ncbi:fasciclin domain-containing protein [Geofilum sp. OHC36d9]|uniref:fasciclin domain-containing protein n=1 Tax=Geofilum sp. OHC36d9 TaxID=3458413 RepID=UPI0040347DA6
MNHLFHNTILSALLLAFIVFVSSCDDKWDKHYYGESDELPDYSLYDYIKSQSDLATFAKLLEISGYDTIINASQSYTVWAPENSSLADIDLTDKIAAETIVKNHIARGSYSTSGIDNKQVGLLNGKYIDFGKTESGQVTYGNAHLIKSNVRAKNGLVHIIDQYNPFQFNIWEYIGNAENMDSLKSYLYGLDQSIFDAESSVEIGINEDGNPIYDSIFIRKNLFLESLGSLDDEDSIYTAVLLNNNAWNMAYNKTAKYFNVPEIYGGSKRSESLSRWAIVQDLVFRNTISNPLSLDSLVSTNGNVFYNPSYLFAGAQQHNLSNGVGYYINEFTYPDTLSWFREIRVEAENEEGRSNANNNIINGSSLGSDIDVSKKGYILLEPSSTSNFARSSVTFAIPNTLSAKYNVYCVFVPPSIADPNNLLPTKTSFQLVYVTTTTGRTSRLRVTPDNNVTNINELTKMFVTKIDFDYANVIDEDFKDVAVTLQVTNDVTIAEESAGDFSRTMSIDCIILEPVEE